MAHIAAVKVNRVKDSGQHCVELDAYYSHIWAYGSSPEDALHKLINHTCMLEVYRPRVAEVLRRLRAWELNYLDLHYVPLTTIVPA
jgi:hypothetical protein